MGKINSEACRRAGDLGERSQQIKKKKPVGFQKKNSLVGNCSRSLCLEYFVTCRIICYDKIHISQPSNKDVPGRVLMASLLKRERETWWFHCVWNERAGE